MVDIHNHIMYGVDDGSINLVQSEKMLRKLYMEGVATIVATPNYGVGCVNASPLELSKKLDELQMAAERISNRLKIYLGNDLYYSDDLLELLRKKQAGTICGTRYVLVNFHGEISFYDLKTSIHRLLIQGYYPILSQVDKYQCLYQNYNLVDELIQLGACMEVTAPNFNVGRFQKYSSYIKRLIEYDMIHFVGSNAKTDLVKTYGMKEAYEIISLRHGKIKANKIFYEHGEILFTNKNITRVS